MKFSFQMVCIAFVVTLAHLVVLATLSPVGADASNRLSISEDEPTEGFESESIPATSEIPLTARPEQTQEPEVEVKEPEVVSIPQDKRINKPKSADLAEVSRGQSQAVEREKGLTDQKRGPHEIRQIEPKPRS